MKFISIIVIALTITSTLADLTSGYKNQCDKDQKCKKKIELNAELLEKLGYNEDSLIIDLRHLCIESIHPDTFVHFQKVIKIDLGFNYLTEVSAPVFANLVYLEQLLLNNNQLVKIGPNVFDNLTGMKLINLNFNKLTEIIAKNFVPMVNLLEFYAANNLISDIDWDNLLLVKLKKFDVHSNQIKQISKCTQYGNLCAVPDAPTVYDYDWGYVDISNNMLTEITKFDLYLIPRMSYLNLAHNQISKIDQNALIYNGALVSLNLDYNKLTEVPTLKCKCNVYDCVNNCSRDSVLGCDFQLRLLTLSFNQIQKITKDDFASLIRLEVLILAYNEISSIEQNSFINNWNLRVLRLEHNDLKVIEENTFKGLWSLKSLNLSWNKIVKIAKCAFKDLISIEVICLNKNPISIKENKMVDSLCNTKSNPLCVIKTTEPCNCYE